MHLLLLISNCFKDSLNELAIETASVLLQRNYDEYSVYLLNAILLHDQNSLIEAREYCVKGKSCKKYLQNTIYRNLLNF